MIPGPRSSGTASSRARAGRRRQPGGSMINQYGFEIGVLGGRHPFVRVGKHRPPIVVLPGLSWTTGRRAGG